MTKSIPTYAEARERYTGSVTEEEIAVVKAMLRDGRYKSEEIATLIRKNMGRVSDINHSLTGEYEEGEERLTTLARHIEPAPIDDLPPPGWNVSPFELHRASRQIWRTRIALEHLRDEVDLVIKALETIEGRQ